MERLSVSVNKSNLFQLQEELALSREGLELLEEKKDALMVHLHMLSIKAGRARRQVMNALATVYGDFRESLMLYGRLHCERVSLVPFLGESVVVREKSFMGVSLPRVAVEAPPISPPYGLYGTGAAMDSVFKTVHDSLESMAELVEIEVGMHRLVAEIKKTLRRINALQNTHIPLYQATVKYIEENLEEKERESLFQLKRRKMRRGEKTHGAV